MGTEANKKRLRGGMHPKVARTRLIQIWGEEHPDSDFETVHGKDVWAWMEVWHKLRLYDWTVDAMIQAFAEKVASGNTQRRKLEHKLSEQKKAINQLADVMSEQRGIIAGLLEAVNGRTKTMEEVEREMLSSPAATVTNPTTDLISDKGE